MHDASKRAIIGLSSLEFYSPSEARREIDKYKSLILERTGLSDEEYHKLIDWLYTEIKFVEQDEIEEYMNEAREIMDNIDEKDTIFIACALSIKNSAIWSDDAHFQRQNKIKVYQTKDINDLVSQ